jgi:hypothetical protein
VTGVGFLREVIGESASRGPAPTDPLLPPQRAGPSPLGSDLANRLIADHVSWCAQLFGLSQRVVLHCNS